MKQLLKIKEDGFYLDEEKFEILSGDIHYFRIYPTEWKRHLLLAKDFGLNTIQTYVPWNLHEPRKGQFDFGCHLDLCAFLDMAAEMGFRVLLRPSPFICSECDFGGLPGWLWQEELTIRCYDERYLKHVAEYYDVLIPKILPYLSTNGGPIIMVGIENEYGGAGYDKQYLKALADMLTDRGVGVPLYTTDNSFGALQMGSLPDTFRASNFRSLYGNATAFYDYSKKHFPQFPFFVGELWSGRAMYWGTGYHKRNPMETVEAYAECLEKGSVNFYMFSGGTNFGFFSGGLIDRAYEEGEDVPLHYIAHMTSYDEDALVSENGLPTEKYYLCRNVLLKHQGKPERYDRDLPFEYETQSIQIKLTEAARLFDNLDTLTERKVWSKWLPTMEDMKQETGFMLYSTEVEGWAECGKKALTIVDVSDRATVYNDEIYAGKVERDRENEAVLIDGTDRTMHIDMLVESLARINGGKQIHQDKKGILGYVTYDCAKIYGYTVRSLPMKDLSGVVYQPLKNLDFRDNDPMFFKGYFNAKPGCDTFLDMRGWGRGFVCINGFNIGRFWEIGPQYTLYIPGGLLKEKDNEIVIFDVNRVEKPQFIDTIEEHILEG